MTRRFALALRVAAANDDHDADTDADTYMTDDMSDFLSRENELLGDEFSTPTGGTFATASGDDIDFDRAASAFPDISLDGDISIPSAPPAAQTSSSGGFSFDDFDSPPRSEDVGREGDGR